MGKHFMNVISLIIVAFLIAGCNSSKVSNVELNTDDKEYMLEQTEENFLEKLSEKMSIMELITEELNEITTNVINVNQDNKHLVSYIIDGDTIVLEEGTRIRLILIDTPEVHGVDTPEPFGQEASEFTKQLLLDKHIILEYDKEKYDPYGRTLAYVYLEDGRMVNELLLEEGLAKVAVFPPNIKYEQRFREIEEKAKKEKKGIWNE